MHKLLQRQLGRLNLTWKELPRGIQRLLHQVDRAYVQADHDRGLLEHSLDITSKELVDQNLRLRDQLAKGRTAEEALRRSEERYDLAVNGADAGIWDWDLASDTIFYSSRWKSLLGYDSAEIGESPTEWLDRIHPNDQLRVRAAVHNHLDGKTPRLEIEYRIRHKSGNYIWALACGVAVRNKSGNPYRMAGSQTDVTARKVAEEQVRHDAIHDALTGLPNRTLFMDRLDHLMTIAQREPGHAFAILFLDLDRFKLVNDSLGHLVGDQLLVETARRFGACLKAGDTLARLGGDEFVILLEEVNEIEEATVVAERLLRELRRPFVIEQHEVYTSASIGIVVDADHQRTSQELLRDADTAMYRAKQEGKACYQVFDAQMHKRAISRLRLENELRRALDEEQFELLYQPIFYLPNRQLTGFEALIRWRHPERGLLSPAEFIPVAEEIGLIVPMDRWVMDKAFTQLAQWQERIPQQQPLHVSVNVSARNFERHGLVEKISAILDHTGLPPYTLQLEITETSLMRENDKRVVDQLLALRELGVFLFLDDFGTGYASLSYLHKLPFNGLKIDRSFTAQMDDDGKNSTFVQTLISLADSLYLFPVVEGIETQSQLESIQSIAACCGQGYHFSHPLPAEEAEQLIISASRFEQQIYQKGTPFHK